MPPSVRFNREEIIQAACTIVCEQGFSALTARNLAARLHCSVAPIYQHFTHIEELHQEVVNEAMRISREYLQKEQGPHVFENIGKASLAFARDYPILLRELVLKPHRYTSDVDRQDYELLAALAHDPLLAHWSEKERKTLLLKMRALQIGLMVLVINNQIPSWFSEYDVEELLMESGKELIIAHDMQREEK